LPWFDRLTTRFEDLPLRPTVATSSALVLSWSKDGRECIG